MQIESRFSLIDAVISTLRDHGKRMPNIISGVDNTKTNIPDMVGTEDDMGAEAGAGRRGSLIDMDNVPVQMTNLIVAAQTYEANVGILSRYKQMTETKPELLG